MAHQAAIDREDYTHPEKIYKGLLPLIYGRLSKEDQEEVNKDPRINISDYKDVELCWSCGWNRYHQQTSCYSSRLRIFHTHGSLGLWEVGSRWLIRDQPNDETVGQDFDTQEFLRQQPGLDLPIVKEMRKLSAPTDKVQITLMSRAEGERLDMIWTTLSPEQKLNIRDQIGDAIKKWRQFTSPVAQSVKGEALNDCLIGFCAQRTAPTCKKVGRSDDEWFANIEAELRIGLSELHDTKDPSVIDEKYQELRRNFPKSEPYVLTHGDLNMSNIIVKDGKLEAIIDWEFSGYFPWWVECYMSYMSGYSFSDEIFDPIWTDSKYGWKMDGHRLFTEVIPNVGRVIDTYNACVKHYTIHPNTNGDRWMRPVFCACKPWRGGWRDRDIGVQTEHKLTDIKQCYPYGYRVGEPCP